jgi:hypothetical protein
MLVRRLLSLLALSLSASAFSFEINDRNSLTQQILPKSDDPEVYPVPGDNPLEFCDDPKDYLLQIDKVDLTPNPPEAYVHPYCG